MSTNNRQHATRAISAFSRDFGRVERAILLKGHTNDMSNLSIMIQLLEYRRFSSHSSCEWRSVLRELLKAIRGLSFGGASTIDMQLVRTITGKMKLTIGRNINEIVLATAIRRRHTPEAIIGAYMRLAYFGENMFGAEQASFIIFGCSASDFSLNQAAKLASMLVAPYPKMHTTLWAERINTRSNYATAIYDRSLELAWFKRLAL